MKNYRSISSPPIKHLKECYNKVFTLFTENNLISHKQQSFKTGDSCMNQILSITHKMYKYFDDGFKGRGVFLNISKAFDKAWYEGFLHK